MTGMRTTLLSLAFGMVAVSPAAAERIQGRLVIGSDTYVVGGSVSRETGRFHLEIVLTQSGGLQRRLLANWGSTDGEATVDGERQRLSAEVIAAWTDQIGTGFTSLLKPAAFRCEINRAVEHCESVGLVTLAPSLAGRLRLSYNLLDSATNRPALANQGRRLVEMRFFSLAEWGNAFFDYVSLSLEFR